MAPVKFLVLAASFLLTTAVFIFLIRRSHPEKRLYWIAGCTLGAVLWLGLIKGIVASIVAIAFSSEYVSTLLDARRLGKRIADSIGIGRNLFFTALEQSLPGMYLTYLAGLERKGIGTIKAREAVLPYVVIGLNMLEARFGPQPQIDAAREAIAPFIDDNRYLDDATNNRSSP